MDWWVGRGESKSKIKEQEQAVGGSGLIELAWSDKMVDVKKITVREFVRQQLQAVDRLKPNEMLEVTEHGKTVFLVTKPQLAKRRRLPRGYLLKKLRALPMTAAEGDEILKQFTGEALF